MSAAEVKRVGQKLCSVDGCARKHKSKGLCGTHYHQLWRKENDKADALKKYHAEYYKKYKDKLCRQQKDYYENNRERIQKRSAKQYKTNPDAAKDRSNKRWAKIKNNPEEKKARAAYRRSHTERFKYLHAKWRKRNRPKLNTYNSRRRARVLGAAGSYTTKQIESLYQRQNGRCAACSVRLGKQYERDHMMPLSSGGSNDIYNIQLLCRPCNRSKNKKDPIVFMQERGFLL